MNIILKTGQSIQQTKEYNMILKITISSTKYRLLLVTFLNFHPIIGINEI